VFLADRTNGRAYATVLRLSVRPSVRRLPVTPHLCNGSRSTYIARIERSSLR